MFGEIIQDYPDRSNIITMVFISERGGRREKESEKEVEIIQLLALKIEGGGAMTRNACSF